MKQKTEEFNFNFKKLKFKCTNPGIKSLAALMAVSVAVVIIILKLIAVLHVWALTLAANPAVLKGLNTLKNKFFKKKT